ncbi:MAG: ABC transporter ATP-binding protein [Clostridiaceae bacterium]|jgi:ABC-type multidrug transport system ATPase subunit|nr:ABC transporter ATP-binding protein [Clostridiaceae bacterium]
MQFELKNIKKSYRAKEVLTDINLKAGGGEIIAIVGENGCGKSTLFKILLGLAVQNNGEIVVDDGSIMTGIVEDPCFYPFMTGRENLDCLVDKLDTANLDFYLKRLEMDEYIDKNVGKYSQGMKQRLGIVYVLLRNADIMIFDEPTNALDPLGIETLRDILSTEKQKGKLILISSHNLYFLDDFADSVYFMIGGKLCKKDEELLKRNRTETVEYVFEVTRQSDAAAILSKAGVSFVISGNKIIINDIKSNVDNSLNALIPCGIKAFYQNTNLSKEYVKIIKNEK